MGADQIAELRPPILEVFAAGPPTDSASWCATFEVDGRSNVWVQVTFDQVNIAYPSERKPTDELAIHKQVPTHAIELADWEPNMYATFSHSGDVNAVAAFIDAYLEHIFMKGTDEYTLNVTMENLS